MFGNQLPCAADAYKMSFGFMPNLSTCNYANMFLKFYVCSDISEKNGLILLIFGTVINNNSPGHNSDLMHVKYPLALCQNVAFYVNYIINCKNQWNLFMLCAVINHHRGFMHIQYTLALLS